MAENLLFESFTDGVQINDVDFVQRRHFLYSGTEFGESFRKKRRGPGDGNVDVGVGVSRTFRPGTEPNDLNVTTQYGSSKLRNLSRDLSRASDKLFRNHRPSVSVLAMMSTGFAGKLIETGGDV